MRHIGLFAGIGGFELAAHWMGWQTIAWVEKNPFCQKVLKHHFPNAKPHEDICTTDFTIYKGHCDIITGGDPCQPSSLAGKRGGQADDRYLWPEMLRAIVECSPCWIVNENVPGSISNGVLDEKIIGLENAGYTCWPPLIIPSGATGTLHRRDRVWLVAYASSTGWEKRDTATLPEGQAEGNVWNNSVCPSEYGTALWGASKSDLLREADGLSCGVDRNKRIVALGNAVNPIIPYRIFQAIQHQRTT